MTTIPLTFIMWKLILMIFFFFCKDLSQKIYFKKKCWKILYIYIYIYLYRFNITQEALVGIEFQLFFLFELLDVG